MRPLAELVSYFAGWLRLCKKNRTYGEQLGVETAQDILVDVVTEQKKIEAVAHKAETYDREALRLIDEAESSSSEGGRFITPKEMAVIRQHVSRSAEMDHDLGEMAKV